MQAVSPKVKKLRDSSKKATCPCHEPVKQPRKKMSYSALTDKQKTNFWKRRVHRELDQMAQQNEAKKAAKTKKEAEAQALRDLSRKRLKDLQQFRAKQAEYIRAKIEEEEAELMRQEVERRRRMRPISAEKQTQCPSPPPRESGPYFSEQVEYTQRPESATMGTQTDLPELREENRDEHYFADQRVNSIAPPIQQRKVQPYLLRDHAGVSPGISNRNPNEKAMQVTPRDLAPAGVTSEHLGKIKTAASQRAEDAEMKTLMQHAYADELKSPPVTPSHRPPGWEASDNPRYRSQKMVPSEFNNQVPMQAYEWFALKKPDVKPPYATNFGKMYLDEENYEESEYDVKLPPVRVNHLGYDIISHEMCNAVSHLAQSAAKTPRLPPINQGADNTNIISTNDYVYQQEGAAAQPRSNSFFAASSEFDADEYQEYLAWKKSRKKSSK